MKIWISLGLLLVFGCESIPPNSSPCSYRGSVHSANGAPLDNVRVTLYEDAWSWNPLDWYPRPDRKITQTRTDTAGRFTLSTAERIPRRKLKIVAERFPPLSPDENPNTPATIKRANTISNPDPGTMHRIIAPLGWVPDP